MVNCFKFFNLTLWLSAFMATTNYVFAVNSVDTENKSPKNISGSFATTISTDSQSFREDSKVYGSEFELITDYAITSKDSISIRGVFSKGLSQGREEVLGNTNVSWNRAGLFATEKYNLSLSSTIILPTSKASRDIEFLNFRLQTSLISSYKFNDKFSATYILRGARNFHEYRTTRDGRNNAEYFLTQIGFLGYQLTDKLSLGQLLIYNNNWSYFGTRRDPSYISISQVNYVLNPSMNLTMGIVTGGSVFNTQMGPDQEIEFFDRNTSSYFTALQVVF